MARTCLPATTSEQSQAEERSLEHILGLPKPRTLVQSCALTLDDVFLRCSSQQYSNSVAASSAPFIMEPGSYRSVWIAFTGWVQRAMLTPGKRMVLIWNIGFISHRLYAMGICIPTFSLADRFKRKYHLTQYLLLDAAPDVRCTSNRIRCPVDVLTSTGLETARALFAIEAICCNIGAMAKEGLSLEISFGVGVLRICDQMARFEFVQHMAEDVKHASSSPRRPEKPSPPSHGAQARRPRAAQPISSIASEPHYGRYLNIATTEALKPALCNLLDSGDEAVKFSAFSMDLEREPNLCDEDQGDLLAERHHVARESRNAMKNRIKTLPQQVLDSHDHLVAATFKPYNRASSSVSANIALHYSYINGHHPGAGGDEARRADFALSPRAQITGQDKAHAGQHVHLYSQRGSRREAYPRDQAVLYGTYLAHGIPDEVVEQIKVETLSAIMTRVACTLPFEVLPNWSRLLHDCDFIGCDNKSRATKAALAPKVSLADSPTPCDTDDSLYDQSIIIQRIFSATIIGFNKSIKKSILDYVLLSKLERKRLGLPRGAPKALSISRQSTCPQIQRPECRSGTVRSGMTKRESCNELAQVVAQRGSALAVPPQYLSAKCRMARNTLQNKLLLTSATFVQCHEIWQDYNNVLLLNLPSIESVLSKSRSDANPPKSQTIVDFERRQVEWLEDVRTMMKEKWLPQVASALFSEDGTSRIGTNKVTDPTAYFNVVALMMSSYLSETIRRTIDSMLIYFEAFLPGSEGCTLPPAFVLVPNLKGSNTNSFISIDVTAAKLRTSISRIIDRVSTAFNDIERIEVWLRRHSQFAQKPRLHENTSRIAVSEHINSEISASSVKVPSNNEQQPAHRERSTFLTLITADDLGFTDARARILHVLHANLKIAAERLSVYQPYEFLLHAAADDELNLLSTLVLPGDTDDGKNNMSKAADAALTCGRKILEVVQVGSSEDINSRLAQLRNMIDSYKRTAVEIALPRNYKPMHLLELDLDGLSSKLIDKALERAQKLTNEFARGITADVTILVKKARGAIVGLQHRPKTVRELLTAHEVVEHARSVDLDKIQNAFLKIWRKVEFLVEHNGLASDVIDAACEACKATRNVQEQIERAAELLVIDKNSMKKSLGKRREQIKAQLTLVGDTVHTFAEKGNAKLLREYRDQLKEVRTALSSEIAIVKELNEEERMLGLATNTEFPSIADICSELHAYELLWNTALRFHMCYSSWLKGAIRSLDGATVMRDHAEMVAVVDKLSNHFNNTRATEPAMVATSIHAQLEHFSPKLPIISALSSKFLAVDDWRKISSVLGFAISSESITNLANLLELCNASPEKIALLDAIAAEAGRTNSPNAKNSSENGQ